MLEEGFKHALTKAPRADLNIFGFSQEIDWEVMDQMAELINTSCLFVKDSGEESAFA